MPHSTDFVVKRLQEVLAQEAVSYFPEIVIREEMAAYIKTLTKVVDWEEDFLADVYDLYLRKVNETGQQLCNNLSGKKPGDSI
ncbi:MAG: hypothetical protein EOP53_24315 [Sphingobacteriales bacterium]|nr:MAG: hypothetical protein EOP53_24315 [Sphingobacteriales bacterium]